VGVSAGPLDSAALDSVAEQAVAAVAHVDVGDVDISGADNVDISDVPASPEPRAARNDWRALERGGMPAALAVVRELGPRLFVARANAFIDNALASRWYERFRRHRDPAHRYAPAGRPPGRFDLANSTLPGRLRLWACARANDNVKSSPPSHRLRPSRASPASRWYEIFRRCRDLGAREPLNEADCGAELDQERHKLLCTFGPGVAEVARLFADFPPFNDTAAEAQLAQQLADFFHCEGDYTPAVCAGGVVRPPAMEQHDDGATIATERCGLALASVPACFGCRLHLTADQKQRRNADNPAENPQTDEERRWLFTRASEGTLDKQEEQWRGARLQRDMLAVAKATQVAFEPGHWAPALYPAANMHGGVFLRAVSPLP
jgi:hypothetical protein